MGLEWDRKLVAAHRDGYSVRATAEKLFASGDKSMMHQINLHHIDGSVEVLWFNDDAVSYGGDWRLRNRIAHHNTVDRANAVSVVERLPNGFQPLKFRWEEGPTNNRHPTWKLTVADGEFNATVCNSWDSACWNVLINQVGYSDFQSEQEAKTFVEHKITQMVIDKVNEANRVLSLFCEPGNLRDAIADHLGREVVSAYDCTRVWEAWSVGTMTQGDFAPLEYRIDEIVDGLMSVISSHGSRATDEAIDRAAMLIWAETRGVRRDIEARWSNIRDDAVVEPFINAARAVFAQPAA